MEQPVPIREEADSYSVPVETVPSSAPPPAPRLPLCITFHYHGQRILCSLVENDAGTLVGLTFDCPLCTQVCMFPRFPGSGFAAYIVAATGALSFDGYVRCLTPGCTLHISIVDGHANACKSWLS